jgi:hypothetical protein
MPSIKLFTVVCLLCSGLVLQASTGWAQMVSPQNVWYEGFVILESGDTLAGNINYDLQNNLVQLQTRDGMKAYSARQLWSYQFYDPDFLIDRHFFALPYTVSANYKAPVLFELLAEGPVTLLVRESIVAENLPQYNYWTNRNYFYTHYRLKHDFYFGFENGNIRQYTGAKKDFFYLIRDKSGEIKRFAKQNRLKYNDKRDLIQIISYYNSLKTNTN